MPGERKIVNLGFLFYSSSHKTSLSRYLTGFLSPKFRIPVQLLLLFFINFTSLAAANATGAEVGQPRHFKDCDACSEMVALPGGSYSMGATVEEFSEGKGYRSMYFNESPQHQVIVKPFAIAKFSVTKHQFSIFARETGFIGKGCKIYNGHDWVVDSDADWKNPGFKQTEQDPVVCVSWDDAQKFIAWFNSKKSDSDSKTYRLPTEEEWEYAARAGTTTPVYWGNDRAQQCIYENARDLSKKNAGLDGPHVNCDVGYTRTSPVGSFQPNPWGLFDMLGDVYQWVADCSHIGYRDPIPAPPALGASDCRMKVVRGASWASVPFAVRAADRLAFKTGVRDSTVGFRLAADLSN
jgi:formylglycine-generating enzyme required for sulfatase activity